MSSTTARAAVAAALVAAAMLAGCSAGRDDSPFIPDTQSTPQAPPVVGAAPVAPAAVPATPAVPVTGQSVVTDTAAADRAVRRAEHQRKVARREEREAKASKRRAAKRAAKREAVLRAKLREARRQEALAAAERAEAQAKPQTKPSTGNKISGSSVETKASRDARADMEARAAVVRYHALLDQRDPAACDLLTPKMLHSFYGADEPGATERCRAGVEGIDQRVNVQILRSAASGPNALLDTVTYIGETSIHQGLAMALVDGTWKIDVVKRLEG